MTPTNEAPAECRVFRGERNEQRRELLEPCAEIVIVVARDKKCRRAARRRSEARHTRAMKLREILIEGVPCVPAERAIFTRKSLEKSLAVETLTFQRVPFSSRVSKENSARKSRPVSRRNVRAAFDSWD